MGKKKKSQQVDCFTSQAGNEQNLLPSQETAKQTYSAYIGRFCIDPAKSDRSLTLITGLFLNTSDIWEYKYYMLAAGVDNHAPCTWFHGNEKHTGNTTIVWLDKNGDVDSTSAMSPVTRIGPKDVWQTTLNVN